MHKLNLTDFPLTGTSVIEASAGTGKTYTITHLYLRLILGHRCVPRTVQQILVVTFTNAATDELKGRIRSKLKSAWQDFYLGKSDDPGIAQLLTEMPDARLAQARLYNAIQHLDEAAIFTIHGFCQRALTEHAFESHASYGLELITDETALLQTAVLDFWRAEILALPPLALGLFTAIMATPQDMLERMRPLLYKQLHFVHGTTEASLQGIADRAAALSSRIQGLKSWWLEHGISERLQNANLNGNKPQAKAANLAAMQAFCHSADLLPDFHEKGLALFTSEALAKAVKKTTSTDLDLQAFTPFDEVCQQLEVLKLELNDFGLRQGLMRVQANLRQQKRQQNLMSTDDLLHDFYAALKGDTHGQLANKVRNEFPVALIDEFQDTDPVQYGIFSRLYAATGKQRDEAPDTAFVMIGDPKQAIYAFRGADIHTYIAAKAATDRARHFTLETNYRSDPALVASVNHLFAAVPDPFMAGDSIGFYPVEAGQPHNQLRIKGSEPAALTFMRYWPENGTPQPFKGVMPVLAEATADDIARLLNLGVSGQASIGSKAVGPSDCCVLVRNREQAQVIKEALAARNIAAVYQARHSVYASATAFELYLVLNALVHPGSETAVRSALVTGLLGLTAEEFDRLVADEQGWQQMLEHFWDWHRAWNRRGLAEAVSEVLWHFATPRRLIERYQDGQRRLTDLRHLIELLQEQAQVTRGQAQLLRHFKQQIADPDDKQDPQQQRLESDQRLVNIVTLHGSKGLEYPLVWVPFACEYKPAKLALFHEQGKLCFDAGKDKENLALADSERLAEDIRLLYVALTRAAHRLCIGLWRTSKTGSKKPTCAFNQQGLGYLMTQGASDVEATLASRLSELVNSNSVAIQAVAPAEPVLFGGSGSEPCTLAPRQLRREIRHHWRVTSYSALARTSLAPAEEDQDILLPGRDDETYALEAISATAANPEDELRLDRFSFPRGPQAGSFLHGVLENIDFTAPHDLQAVIDTQARLFGIDELWAPTVHTWLEDVLATPLNALRLNQLSPGKVKIELEFLLPIRQVDARVFNRLIARYSHKANYDFDRLTGMLKGFIDLVFEHDGQYFVADYKSNHLGDDYGSYTPAAMQHAMEEHDYLLQAILYTLVLHRWLKTSLPDYDYQRHIGGAYYLFLRGMHPKQAGQGVWFKRLPEALILSLDALFDGQPPEQDGPEKPAGNQPQGQLSLWEQL